MTKFNRNLVRVDKNISYHYNYFKKYSFDDSKLMFMLLVYFAKQHQQDLFGAGTLDPVLFCKEFGLSPQNYIWAKHPNPRQLAETSEESLEKIGIPIFDTIFENALYCLYADIFQFPKGKFYLSKVGKYQNGETIDSIQFITSLTKKTIQVGRNLKKVYEYDLSERFISNLSFLFFNVNLNSLKITTKKNSDGLYFFIKNLINEMRGRNESIRELDFNEVKERLGINSDNARYIKNKINKAFADFSNLEDLKQVQFEWFKKPSHRYEYGIHIKIEGGAMVQQNEMIIENTWREVKEDLLKKMLLDAFKRRYPEKAYLPIPELREEYIKWLKNEQIDIDSKKTAYVDYMKNTNTKDMAQKLAFFVDGFPKELSKNYQKYI